MIVQDNPQNFLIQAKQSYDNLDFKLKFLHQDNQMLKQKIQILQEKNKHYQHMIKKMVSQEPNSQINQFLQSQLTISERLQKIITKNIQLSSQLLLVRQTSSQQQKFHRQILLNYQQKILQLRKLCQLKQVYVQNHQLFNLHQYKSYLIKTSSQSLKFIEEKQSLLMLVKNMKRKIQKLEWDIMEMNRNRMRNEDIPESSQCLDKSSKYHIEQFQTNDRSYSMVNTSQNKFNQSHFNSNYRNNKSKEKCSECKNIKVEIQKMFIKMSEMVNIVQKYKKQNKYIKIKLNLIKMEYLNLQEILAKKTKQQLIKKQCEVSDRREKSGKIKNKQLDVAYSRDGLRKKSDQENNGSDSQEIETNQQFAFQNQQFNQISAIGDKLLKANIKNYIPKQFTQLDIF